jgi:hypothetical protein
MVEPMRAWSCLISPAHVDPQPGVEVAERLVEQEEQGIAHQGAAHRDPLALAAGELRRLALEQAVDLQQCGDPRHRLVLLRLGHAAAFHAEGDVAADRHRRIERVGLEHHGDVAVLGRYGVDHPVADLDSAAVWLLQPGDHVQQRGLAAARRAQQHGELAVLDREVDALQHLGVAEALVQTPDAERRHAVSYLPTT